MQNLDGLVKIKLQMLDKNVKIPEYKLPGDAGMDIYSNENVHIQPGQTIAVSTGIKLQIPVGYYLAIVPRSGLSKNTPLRIANSPGTIDCGYRGEIKILLLNTSEKNYLYSQIYNLDQKGNVPGIYNIQKGDRIAQMILKRFEFMMFDVVDELDISKRGSEGFGSTGR